MQFSDPYRVLERSANTLRLRTGSTRILSVFILLGSLLTGQTNLQLAGAGFALIAWSFQKEWIFDKTTGEIRSEVSVLWMRYESACYSLNIRGVRIERKRDSESDDYWYTLNLYGRDKTRCKLTGATLDLKGLQALVEEFKPYLPEDVSYNLDADRGKRTDWFLD